MVVAGALFGLMALFVKLGADHFSSAELVFYRSLLGLLVIGAIARGQGLPLATRHLKGHLWRGVSGLASLASYFYCITVLPLATAVTLNYTSPLFVALLTTLLLRERLHWPLGVAVALGFAGVVVLLKPTLQEGQFAAGLLGLTSGFFACVAYLNVRQLGRLGEPDWRVVFYFTLVSTALSGLWLLHQGVHALTLERAPLLLGLGVSATLAQLALTRAYRTGATLVVSSLSYSTVVFSSLFGVLFLGEFLPPSGWLAVGLIVAAGLLGMRSAPVRSA